MKLMFFAVLASVTLLGCSPPVVEQAKRLGTTPYSREAWANANKLDRAQMLWSFLSQHDVTAFTPAQVREYLGPHTCYSGYDSDPTYCIGPDTVDNGWGEGYMVVFIKDREGSGKIREVDIIPEPE